MMAKNTYQIEKEGNRFQLLPMNGEIDQGYNNKVIFCYSKQFSKIAKISKYYFAISPKDVVPTRKECCYITDW